MTSLFDAQTENDVIEALESGEDINEIRRRETPLIMACNFGNRNHTSPARYDWRRI